jgi:predicted ATPase
MEVPDERTPPAEAGRTYEAMAAAYQQSGYELVTLPRTSRRERLRFVREVTGLSPDAAAGAGDRRA